MPPTVPINHYDGPRNQQNRSKRPILLFHANIFMLLACFEHSNFFKVIVLVQLLKNLIIYPEGKTYILSSTRFPSD